ncbi:unnamed protein product [Urochloa decumbens]|uniref:Neprosin PEP catalytic domain-containing protein n=1 Tax=Urochloa decumbens TaxID=240449 RepID=A0ABC9AV18_9POAL
MAATTRACLVALVVALAFLFSEGPSMVASGSSAGGSVERLREARNFLRRVNKAPVISIQSPDGDIIDCVPISKQPAFDHPLLKNHTIQMQPSYHPYADSKIAPHPVTQTWHQNGKCPENTIPIRRTKEEDVLRASSVNWYGKKGPKDLQKFHPEASATSGAHQYAVASTAAGNYYGTEVNINLWKPVTETHDFSLTQLWIIAGSYSNNDLNTIETGWQVFQDLYGDNNTRLFIYWTRDAYQTTGCYNLCPGFVQTNNQIAIGGTLSPQSVYGGSQYEICVLVWKDPDSSNWWLQVGGIDVGYWPSNIFTHLADSASNVEWGGEVAPFENGQTSTQMGSGHFPSEGFGKASYIRNIQVVDSSNHLSSVNGLSLINPTPNCYNIQNGTSSNDWGTYIFYGGPGRNPNCS